MFLVVMRGFLGGCFGVGVWNGSGSFWGVVVVEGGFSFDF